MAGSSDIGQTAPAAGADLAQAHRQLLTDHALQFKFDQVPPPAPPPTWLEALARFFSSIAPMSRYVFWGGVIILAALVVWLLVREIAKRIAPLRISTEAEIDAPAPTPQFHPQRERARALLSEADRLAGEGRFGEAVRVLLHRSIEDMERGLAITIGVALTSREILQLEFLSYHGRAAFGAIARAVETSLFGGQALDAARFAECRGAYEAFAFQRGGR